LILLALSRARKKKEAVGPDAFYLKEKRSVESIGRNRRIRRIMRVINVLGKKGKRGRGSRASPRPEKAKRSSSSSPLFGSVCFINEELEELRGSVGLLCNFLGPKNILSGRIKCVFFLLDIASFLLWRVCSKRKTRGG
jgi:hypothetical protein